MFSALGTAGIYLTTWRGENISQKVSAGQKNTWFGGSSNENTGPELTNQGPGSPGHVPMVTQSLP